MTKHDYLLNVSVRVKVLTRKIKRILLKGLITLQEPFKFKFFIVNFNYIFLLALSAVKTTYMLFFILNSNDKVT